MRTLSYAAITLATSFTAVAAADAFDGSVPLICIAEQAHDCLPATNACKRLEPQTDIAPIFKVDYAKKEIRSPYRNALLRIMRTSVNPDSLVMQGGDLLVAWSALIDKKTGALTIAIGDSMGAYVAFGHCKVAEEKK